MIMIIIMLVKFAANIRVGMGGVYQHIINKIKRILQKQ